MNTIEKGSFAEKVAFLDSALTGKDWATVCQTALNQQKSLTPVGFMTEGEYYLSDCGYSRIVYSWSLGIIRLTSNSRSEVYESWERCHELRHGIEDVLDWALRQSE